MEFNPNLVSTPRQEGMRSPGGLGSSYLDNQSIRSPPLAGSEGFYQAGSPQQFNAQQSSYYQPAHGNSLSHPFNAQQQQFMQRQPHEIIFSSRHDALYLIVSRVLYPIWTRPVVKQELSNGPGSPSVVSWVVII